MMLRNRGVVVAFHRRRGAATPLREAGELAGEVRVEVEELHGRDGLEGGFALCAFEAEWRGGHEELAGREAVAEIEVEVVFEVALDAVHELGEAAGEPADGTGLGAEVHDGLAAEEVLVTELVLGEGDVIGSRPGVERGDGADGAQGMPLRLQDAAAEVERAVMEDEAAGGHDDFPELRREITEVGVVRGAVLRLPGDAGRGGHFGDGGWEDAGDAGERDFEGLVPHNSRCFRAKFE
jgi:hypothetical protein